MQVMSNLKVILPILWSKLSGKLVQVLNVGSGTSLPGKIALKLSPCIMKALVNQSKQGILTITGTNGKTTTAGFVAGILRADGRNIAHNRKGANMLEGITTALIESSDFAGNLNADNCLLEIDEAYLQKAVDSFSPELLLVTNLFRDQLDRYGELDTTAKKIQVAIDKIDKLQGFKVILNADDPMVSALAKNNAAPKIFYGFENVEFVAQDTAINSPQEVVNCKCGKKYGYNKVFYGQLGHYVCDCGQNRPVPHVSASVQVYPAYSVLNIKSNKSRDFQVKIKMPGLYNAYNALGAATMAIELGISAETVIKGIEEYSTVFGRAELIHIKGKQVLIQLIKNPIGATEVLRTVKDDKNSRLLIIINDNYADGRDVSWLWDANFELLGSHSNIIVTSGIRAEDMAVRLKYAGIESDKLKVISDIKEAVYFSAENTSDAEKLYILPTYTALLELQKFLPLSK